MYYPISQYPIQPDEDDAEQRTEHYHRRHHAGDQQPHRQHHSRGVQAESPRSVHVALPEAHPQHEHQARQRLHLHQAEAGVSHGLQAGRGLAEEQPHEHAEEQTQEDPQGEIGAQRTHGKANRHVGETAGHRVSSGPSDRSGRTKIALRSTSVKLRPEQPPIEHGAPTDSWTGRVHRRMLALLLPPHGPSAHRGWCRSSEGAR